jgi:hypothetical protein
MSKKTIYTSIAIIMLILVSGCTTKQQGSVVSQEAQKESVVTQEETTEEKAQITDEGGEVLEGEGGVTLVKFDIGETVKMSDLTFKVNEYEEAESISSQYSTRPETAKKGTKFIVIDLDVTNEANTDVMFDPNEYFILFDATKERQYTTYDESIGNIDDYLNFKNLSPGIPETGKLVYLIPEDVIDYGLFSYDEAEYQPYYVPLALSKNATEEDNKAPEQATEEVEQ